ncbi:MAG: DNA-binding transcriptional ArsR family regulator [Granulosicoccus sp.]|jgi:DNA-binding transcriptional ArsR family regulator
MALPRFNKDASAEELLQLQTQARRASELMKALSHETRLLILCLLTEKEMSVSELEEIIGLSQAAVSQQLARLRLERLVSTRREGRQIYYRIVDNEVNTIIESLYDLFCKPVRE